VSTATRDQPRLAVGPGGRPLSSRNESALGFYRRLGAQALDDWIVHRLSGDALRRLATGDAAIPG